MKTALRQNRLIVYGLKRRYGLSIAYYRPTRTTNDNTGKVSTEWLTFTIKRAILGPRTLLISFAREIGAAIAGDGYEVSAKVFIIDKKDLPIGFTPDLKDHIEAASKRWEFKEIVEAEESSSYLILAVHTEGAELIG